MQFFLPVLLWFAWGKSKQLAFFPVPLVQCTVVILKDRNLQANKMIQRHQIHLV